MFLLFYDWSVSLPSGAKWKPVMVFVLTSMMVIPPLFSCLIVIPGVLVSAIRRKDHVWNFFTTIGHLSAGMLAGGSLFYDVFSVQSLDSPRAHFALVVALVAHFIVNRLLTVLILTYRKRNGFLVNLKGIYKEINWTYLCIYSLGLVMILVSHTYGYLGILATLIVLVSLFKSVGYYQKYKMIAKTAFVDALTSAENRAAWEIFKSTLSAEPRPGTLVMVDLDEFKMINDTYGHVEGDGILKEFVQYVQNRVQREHRLFRYGGDEFVLYLPHELDETAHCAKQIEQVLNKLNASWKEKELPVSVSFGFASLKDPTDVDRSIELADQRMYRVKEDKKAL